MKVNFLLVGLILLPDTSNGENCRDTCWSLFLDNPCLSNCKGVRCPHHDLRDSFEKLCIEEGMSIEETVEISCVKVTGNEYDLYIQKTCCGDEVEDCKETHQTCEMKIHGKKFNVTMSTSCCDDEPGECTDGDNDSSVPTTFTTTPANEDTTPSTSANDPTDPTTLISTNGLEGKDGDNDSSVPTTFTTTPANEDTTPSTSANDPTDPTTLISTNGLEGKDENLHGSAAGSTDTGTLAGGIVGGLLGGVVITVVVVVVWWSCRRRRRRDQEANFRAIESGRSKTKTPPVVIPDVIKMSSSSLNVDDHEYNVISESQSRKLESGDYVDIKEEDLQKGNTDYELAGGINKISINHVEMKAQNSARGETEYELAGGFQETSNGSRNQNVNDDDYNRLGDGSIDRPTAGTDYDKVGGRECRGQDLAADYFVLEEQGNQEQYNKLRAAATTVDGQDTYNRLRGAGTDVKVDKQDNKLGDSKGQSTKPKENAYEDAEDDTYNRLGQAGRAVTVEKQDSKLGYDHSSAATDTCNRLGQEGHEQYKKARDNAYEEAAGDVHKQLGKDGIGAKKDTPDKEISEYFVLEEQTREEQ